MAAVAGNPSVTCGDSSPKGEPRNTNLQSPYQINLTACTSNTSKSQHYRYRQGQLAALACPRRTARYERIPPDGFGVAALESTLYGRTPPPASLVPLPFQGRLMHKSTGRCGHRPLHIPRGSSMKFNISGKIIGSRRWQAPGGQRGTSEFRRTVSTRLPQKVHFTKEPHHCLTTVPLPL